MHKYHSRNINSRLTTAPAPETAYQQAQNILFANPRPKPQHHGLTVEQEWMLYRAESIDTEIDPVSYWEVSGIF